MTTLRTLLNRYSSLLRDISSITLNGYVKTKKRKPVSGSIGKPWYRFLITALVKEDKVTSTCSTNNEQPADIDQASDELLRTAGGEDGRQKERPGK